MRIFIGKLFILYSSKITAKKINKLAVAFMFESSMIFTITNYAMNRSGKLHGWLIYFQIDDYGPLRGPLSLSSSGAKDVGRLERSIYESHPRNQCGLEGCWSSSIGVRVGKIVIVLCSFASSFVFFIMWNWMCISSCPVMLWGVCIRRSHQKPAGRLWHKLLHEFMKSYL